MSAHAASKHAKHEAKAAEHAKPESKEPVEPKSPEPIEVNAEPVEIVDLDAQLAEEALTPQEKAKGQSFWFGNGPELIDLGNGKTHHVRERREFVTDPDTIEALKRLAGNPAKRIIVE